MTVCTKKILICIYLNINFYFAAQSGTECAEPNQCSDICTLVGGTPVCSCPRGYELGPDDVTCQGK